MFIGFHPQRFPWLRTASFGLPLVLLLLSTACSRSDRAADKIAKDASQVEQFDNSLTFNAVTLEEFDKKGQLWWRVKAKQASYSKDKKLARIVEPKGEFYQDGKPILKVSAQSGEVQKDGEKMFLRGNIIATDTKDGMVLRGNELEWQPKANLVIVRNNVTGTHPKLKFSAKQGQFQTKERRVQMEGAVTAVATDPAAKFQSDRVIWLMQPNTLTSDRPLQIERFVNNVLSDRATSNEGFVDLKGKKATLKQNTQLLVSDPPVQINTNQLVWDIKDKVATSDVPVTIVNRQQGVTLTGNQGRLEFTPKMIYLQGDVRGFSERNQAQVKSDNLTWNMKTQEFEATGNVNYQQVDPVFNLTGPRATGKLQDKTVVVSGGRVETQFIPEQVGKLVNK
jgi:LPS export ABC transporter protein LptC